MRPSSLFQQNRRLFQIFLAIFFLLPALPIGWLVRALFLGLGWYFYLNYNLFVNNSELPQDKIQQALFWIIIYTGFGYAFHWKDSEIMALNTYRVAGTRTDLVFYHIILNGLTTLLICLGMYICGRKLAHWNEDRPLLFRLYLAVSGLVIGSNLLAWVKQTGGALGRYNYQPLILNFGDIALFSLIALWFAWAILGRWYRNLVISICLFNLAVSGVRKYIGLVIIQALIASFYHFRDRLGPRARVMTVTGSLLLLALLAGLALASGNQVITGLVDPNNPDVFSRTITIASALEMFLSNPILGVGYGTFGARNTAVISYSGGDFILASPHNGLAAILAEYGILGLGLVLWLVYQFLRDDFQALRNWRILGRLELAIALTSIGQIMLSPLSNFTFIPPPNEFASLGSATILWISAGLLSERLRMSQVSGLRP